MFRRSNVTSPSSEVPRSRAGIQDRRQQLLLRFAADAREIGSQPGALALRHMALGTRFLERLFSSGHISLQLQHVTMGLNDL